MEKSSNIGAQTEQDWMNRLERACFVVIFAKFQEFAKLLKTILQYTKETIYLH